MSIRVEWLDDNHHILCCTPQKGWNWEEGHRVLEEWVRPLLANTRNNVGIVADLRQAGIFGADADLLLKRLNQMVHDSLRAKALAVVGLKQQRPEYICVDTMADATQRLDYILRSNNS